MQKRLYGDNSGVKSRVNLAAAQILREVVTDVNGEVVLQMEKVQITKGDLTGFQDLAVTSAAGGMLNFTWTDNSSQMMAKDTDIFSCAVYREEVGDFYVQEGPEMRTTAAASVALPADWMGATVHVYAFFQNEAQDQACNSVYLGEASVI